MIKWGLQRDRNFWTTTLWNMPQYDWTLPSNGSTNYQSQILLMDKVSEKPVEMHETQYCNEWTIRRIRKVAAYQVVQDFAYQQYDSSGKPFGILRLKQ